MVPAPGALCRQRRPPRASYPVFEPDQAGSAGGVGAAAAVVAHRDSQQAIVGVNVDVCGGGVGVFGGVCQRLGHQVVGGNLDGLR